LDVVELTIQTKNRISDLRHLWITLCSQDNADRCAAIGIQLARPKLPPSARHQERQYVLAQLHHQNLSLGIPEAAVELEHLRSGRGQHQPGVERPAKGAPTPRHLAKNRLDHLRAYPAQPTCV